MKLFFHSFAHPNNKEKEKGSPLFLHASQQQNKQISKVFFPSFTHHTNKTKKINEARSFTFSCITATK
jgi:hypothetical protein